MASITSTRSSADRIGVARLSVALALSVSFPSLVRAQSAVTPPAGATNDGGLQDIVVTAQRKEQGLQKVPVAVEVVDGKALQQQGVPDLERLSTSLPAVTVRRSANSQRIVIRGVGSGTNRGFEQSVGTFVDGVYYSQGQQIRPKLFDVARVEVLKGPQSILFGANVTAGAFNIVTNDPTDHLSGSANLIVGERNEFEETGAISGPITDDLSVRVSGYKRNYDGDVYNTQTREHAQNEDNYGGRVILRYKPAGPLTVRASYEHQQLRLRGNPIELYYDPSVAAAYTTRLGMPGVLDYKSFGGVLTSFKAVPDGQAHDTLKTDTASIRADYNAGPFVLTSESAFTHFMWDNVSEFGYSPEQQLGAEVTQHFRQFSQEFRADGKVTNWFEIIGGAYYHHQDLHNFVLTESVPLNATATSPATQNTDYWAVFGQGTAHLTDQLRLTGGLRYDGLSKDVHDALVYSRTGVSLFGGVAHDLTASRHENHLSWLGRVEYDLRAGVLAYATASRGYKAGGFDINGYGTSNGTTRSATFAFAPEQATNYEAGVKARLFNNHATLNINAYHLEYNNLQVSQLVGAAFSVGNANARSNGFEIDYRQAVTHELTLSGTYAYNDFKFTSYLGAPCNQRQTNGLAPGCNLATRTQDLTGKTGEFAPKSSASLNVDWRSPLTDKFDVLLNANPIFSSNYYTQVGLDSNAYQKGYTLINARIGIASNDDRWQIQVIGRNLSDRAVSVNSFNGSVLPLSYGKVPIQRRGVAAQLSYNF